MVSLLGNKFECITLNVNNFGESCQTGEGGMQKRKK